MARPVGLPKTGGRKAGTPNQKTTFLKQTLEELGYDLPTKITKLLPKLSPEKQVDVLLELMQYAYPKRKAVGSTSDKEDWPQVIITLPSNGRTAEEQAAHKHILANQKPDAKTFFKKADEETVG